MSDAEKLVEAGLKYNDEPLILRPKVGGDILGSRETGRTCWPRSFILRLMLICVLLATIAGFILIIFTLHHSGTWPWNHFNRRYASAMGSCRVLTPFPGIGMQERFLYEPNAITITHGSVAGFPPVTSFHLLKEAMSVMRTHGICYVYPLDSDIAEAVPMDDSVVERIKEASEPSMTQIKSPFGVRVFMVSPNSNYNVKIEHPAAAANCSNVPILRLIEMVLSQTDDQPDFVSLAISVCMLPSCGSRDQDIRYFLDNREGLVQSTESTAFPSIPCPNECTWGGSRADPLRQVCRCPPKDNPPSIRLFPSLQQKEPEPEPETKDDNGGVIQAYPPLPSPSNDNQFQVDDNEEAVVFPDSNEPANLDTETSEKDKFDMADVSDEDDEEEEEEEEEEEIDNDQDDLDDEFGK
ncbi:unnamed protein product [Rodentolepis nana]|uniref:Conserved plasma membrane protein n=1 Tax=Rodentolepis nana TaxID=102285 RepID=A0A0R3TBE9_RODNA|nr:unnamed protein product [Rodentolepis nana]